MCLGSVFVWLAGPVLDAFLVKVNVWWWAASICCLDLGVVPSRVLANTDGGWRPPAAVRSGDDESVVALIDCARRTTPGLAGWWRISFNVLTASATLSDRSGIVTASFCVAAVVVVSSSAVSSRKSGGGGKAAKSISSTDDVVSCGGGTMSEKKEKKMKKTIHFVVERRAWYRRGGPRRRCWLRGAWRTTGWTSVS